MAASDQFKEALAAGNIGKALTIALGEAVELDITTWVSETPPPGSENADDYNRPRPGFRMHTRINIVDGDIENEIGREFLDGPYAELRDFHLREVDKGMGIIRQNLDNLQQLFLTLSDTLQGLSRISRSRPASADPRLLSSSESHPGSPPTS
ncbi:MAG: hypothetical protein IGR80_18510 [Synechococcales cyanobacterium K44_A2020_017]|uniref:hypothetical protein n=1 Tax=Leptolyngbya sp. CCY15150 TaxID=2767772 RepID=UPI00195195A9|nr:hypothetical protein [Leptolyngbya sp. CCY15150]MBF2089635.1 hypothetical protein [Synechococcales cyanobacterium K32_A2020_035]MBF2096732.1 hypothetical protein [Synechococcales cyanobacterium K44_A2020_017]